MTVRFPSGVSIQYNTANYVYRNGAGYTDLYTKKDGVWIAQVPNSGCVVESVPACRVYNPAATDSDKVQSAVAELAKTILSLKRKLAKLEGK